MPSVIWKTRRSSLNQGTAVAPKGWKSLLHHWGKDFQLLFYITVTLQLFRLLLITVFHGQIGPRGDLDSVLMVLGNGLRYDISTAGVWVAPTFLASLAVTAFPIGRFIGKARYISASLFAIISILIFGVDLVFFSVYGDQFNQMVFGLAYDDTTAILLTIWKEYHPLLFISIATPLVLLNLWLIRRWMRSTPSVPGLNLHHRSLGARVVMGMMIFLVMTAAVRGGTLWGEPIRLKHAFVVNDLFLNRTVVNPFTALRYTLKVKLELEGRAALKQFWPSQKIGEAVQYELNQRGESRGNKQNLDKLLSVSAAGYEGRKPKHIFLILMESHSGWTVMPAYRELGLSPAFSSLADDGIYFPNFLPAGSGTIGSLSALVTGMPDAGLNINYEQSSQTAYPSALAANLKKLGYTTRFFYGGFLSWQRLDSFATHQGFVEIYGGGDMSAGKNTNEWGVDDSYLFDYVLKTVKQDPDKPSFNFILSTSNHPPYDLDLAALGYPLNGKTLPAPLKPTKDDTGKVLGHLWYADQQAGHFVRNAARQLDRSVFAITGDHTARLRIKFPGDNVAEQTAVPFILYGPQVLPESGVVKKTAGSHMDIPSTLIELAADPGYRYTAFGHNLLDKPSPSYGFGWEFIMGENFIANDSEHYKLFSLAGGPPAPSELPQMDREVKRFNALKALSWYRVKKGAKLPVPKQTLATSAQAQEPN